MKLKFKVFVITLFMLLGWEASQAQVTNAGITGFIRDGQHQPLPGATIKATHLPSGSVYGTVTQIEGNYIIQGMRPGGPYKIEVTYLGMAPKVTDNIQLALGENYVLNINMAEEGATIQEVQIVGRVNPILNSDRTGAATNINSLTISRMPTITRSLSDYTRLTPQANGNGFAGRDGRFNNLQIDGANFNNGFGLSSDALPGGGNQPISLDAIEEVQVNIAPYDVRQTGFTGAGINAITRSGTNDITGSVYGFLRPKSFTGLKVGDEELDELSRVSSKIIGARLGAPIVKNKLFFFGSFEYENALTSGNNWLANRPGLSGENVTRVSASDLETVSSFLKNEYGYDPGAYENYANNYANKNLKALVRLDWNINDRNKFTIRYNQMTGTSDQGTNASSGPNPRSGPARISSESIAFENANYAFSNTVRSLTAELNSNFSNRLSNQFLATYSHIRDTRSTPGDLFPFVDIWDGDLQPDGKAKSNYMSFGTELFSYNNDVINNNFTITDNLTYLAGRHTLTGGISFQSMSYANSYVRMGTSYYRYNSLESFLNKEQPDVFGITYPFEGTDGYAKVKFGLAGIYLQDQIAVSPRLKVTGGVRVDMPIFLDKPPANPLVDTVTLLDQQGEQTHYTTAKWPRSKPLFSPRVGFNYDVLGNRTLQLRGGTGIFTGNIPFVWFTNMPTNAGVLQNTFEPVDSATRSMITEFNKDPQHWVNELPDRFPKEPGKKLPGSVSLIDPAFKMPQVWRTNLGIDYKISSTPFTATMDLIYTKDINAVYQFNANRKAAVQQMDYSGDDRSFWNGKSNAKYNAGMGDIIPVLSNTNKGYSLAATIGVNMSPFHGFTGSLFYTYSDAKDVTGNPGSAANSVWSNNYSINDPNELLLGISQFSIPHRVVGNISYRAEYANHLATTVSLFYNGQHQGRYAYTYNGDINQDGVSLDLLYVPANSSDLNFADITDKDGNVLFTPKEQREAFDKFVANSKQLTDAKGGYVARNNGLMPWLNRWDFRLLQDIFVTENNSGRRHSLQLSLDVLNIGNLLSKSWGLYKQLNTGSLYNYGLLNVSAVSPEGEPTFNMITIQDEQGNTVLPDSPYRNLFGTSSTWGMQIGLRYTF